MKNRCSSVALRDGPASPAHLQQGHHGAAGVPQHGGQVRNHLPPLAELQQGVLPALWTGQLVDPLVDPFSVHQCQC